jgi:hypothetical protein
MIHFTIRPINYKLKNYFFKGCTVLGPWTLKIEPQKKTHT